MRSSVLLLLLLVAAEHAIAAELGLDLVHAQVAKQRLVPVVKHRVGALPPAAVGWGGNRVKPPTGINQ